jgi:hypothetical protein
MGRCCGGKNAGKPISLPRYIAGIGVFCVYHTAIKVVLEVASVPRPDLRKVRDFHSTLFKVELKEILAREDINLPSRLLPQDDEFCPIDEGVWPEDWDDPPGATEAA